MWKNVHNGQVEHSVAIFRSYHDRKTGQMKRHYYYGEQDLKDVVQIANEGRDELHELQGLTQAKVTD